MLTEWVGAVNQHSIALAAVADPEMFHWWGGGGGGHCSAGALGCALSSLVGSRGESLGYRTTCSFDN